MATTPVQIAELHPEFQGVPTALIQDAIDRASRRVDPEMYLETTDDAIRLLACHTLALSPYGQAARLVGADGSTPYKIEFDELRSEAAIGFRVI